MSSPRKLSLEQRLSLATKATQKRRLKKSSPALTAGSDATGEDSISSPVDEREGQKPSRPANDTSSAEASVAHAHNGIPAPFTEVFPNGLEGKDMETVLAELAPHFQRLRAMSPTTRIDAQPHREISTDSSLLLLVKEKDARIEELLEEQQETSAKERRATQALSKMEKKYNKQVAESAALEQKLRKQASENVLLKEEKDKAKAELKACRADYQQMKDACSAADSRYASLTHEQEALQCQLEDCEKEVLAARTGFETSKANWEKKEKELNARYNSLRKSSNDEITRLEGVMERLRLEAEDSRDIRVRKQDDNPVHAESEYQSLLRQLEDQQRQAVISRENWSSIEYSMNQKIEELQTQLEEIQSSCAVLETRLGAADEERRRLVMELDRLGRENAKLKEASGILELDYKKATNNLKKLEEDHRLLAEKYKIQKLNLESRLGGKREVLQDKESLGENLLLPTSAEIKDAFQSLNGQQGMSAQSIATGHYESGLSSNYDFDMPVDETLSQTAEISGDDLPEDSTSDARKTTTDFRSTISADQAGISAQMHVNAHIVNKLGAEVRRLELEISTLKAFNNTLEEEKARAEDDILKLLEENHTVHHLKTTNEALTTKVADYSNRQDTILQLLGEKTERVEELENDVEDLKQMLRMQAQQLADMQERLRI
ncbi:ABL071Wp [Eremothecium gossypii ATCC 10895]|uniref:ABL071Wp n=1 Tax=Eremothecium gossypii (strain ATCC 10895 / CBS 109.51 / FGSC 9923 / NRRL Y-1056) TaxID=284811 RepID=Q75DU4_EREGS|nr:ABL071Wp [Eremothecium gossypii ATCC 10895]AAS50700.1 ABL071Wp [Eremothecium gossypii ATCC 10895]